MAFKLFIDETQHYPHLVCDVCGLKVNDLWNGKATSTPGAVGQTSDISVHHPDCVVAGTVTIRLIDFIQLFIIKNMVGNISNSGGMDRSSLEYTEGKGFEV